MATTKKVNRSSTKAKPKVNVARTKKSSIATKSLNSTKLANDSATSSTSKVENIALIQSETESTSKTQSSVNESETVVKSEPQPSHNTVEKTTITPTDANASKEEQSLASNMEIFKMQNFEIPFAVREVAEKSIEQARATYDKVKSAAAKQQLVSLKIQLSLHVSTSLKLTKKFWMLQKRTLVQHLNSAKM